MSKCIQCGFCCRHICVDVTNYTQENKDLLTLRHGFIRYFNYGLNIYAIIENECVYLHLEDNTCTNYIDRPSLCKRYPNNIPKEFNKKFNKECGYND